MRPRPLLLILTGFLLCLALVSGQAGAVDYVGLRVSLPLGGLPPLVGAEVGMRLSPGWWSASVLVSWDGRTLMVGSVDVVLGEPAAWGEAAFRLSVGLSYLELGAGLPAPFAGAGVACTVRPFEAVRVRAAAEVLYPVAFGPPLISLGGGWSLK